MSRAPWILPVFLMLSLCACAGLRLSDTRAQQAQSLGVNAVVVNKLKHGDHLNLTDIEHLAARRAPDGLITDHVRYSRSIYQLTTRQIDELRTAGVSVEVIDFLLATPQINARPVPAAPIYPSRETVIFVPMKK